MKWILKAQSLVYLGLWSSLTAASPLSGHPDWDLSAQEFETTTLSDRFFELTPNDGRPGVLIPEAIAFQLRNGRLDPRAVYEETRSGKKKNSDMGFQPFEEAPTFSGAEEKKTIEAIPPPAITTPYASTSAWDPEGRSRPPFDAVKRLLACQKPQLPSANPMAATPEQIEAALKMKTRFVCNEKDAIEMVKREAYSICSASKQGPNAGSTQSAKILSQIPAGSLTTEGLKAIGTFTCNNGQTFGVMVQFREFEDVCWACEQQIGDLSFGSNALHFPSPVLYSPLNTSGASRSSPNQLEGQPDDAYWQGAH